LKGGERSKLKGTEGKEGKTLRVGKKIRRNKKTPQT